MTTIGHFSDAAASRIDYMLPSGAAWAGDLMLSGGDPAAPHALYVHQDPGVRLERHYHDNAQFQVVVRGGGKLGTHDVAPFSIHYASFQSVYGPLIAGADGLDYITLRAVCDRTIHFFPEDRARMDPEPRRRQDYADVDPSSAEALAQRTTAEISVLITRAHGGPGADLLRQPGGSQVEIAAPPDGVAGQFLMVVSGTAQLAGEKMQTMSTTWLPRDTSVTLKIGAGGADILLLHLPADGAT